MSRALAARPPGLPALRTSTALGMSAVLGISAALVGCVELVAPPERPPRLVISITVVDSAETRVDIAASLAPARESDGSTAAVEDAGLRIGGVDVPVINATEAEVAYGLSAAGEEAGVLLESLFSAPVSAPEVAGHGQPPSLTPAAPLLRLGPADLVWTGGDDLVLPTTRPPTLETPGFRGGEWVLTLVQLGEASPGAILRITGTGELPAEVRVPADLLAGCDPAGLRAELRFTVNEITDPDARDDYSISARTSGTIWWEVVRECP